MFRLMRRNITKKTAITDTPAQVSENKFSVPRLRNRFDNTEFNLSPTKTIEFKGVSNREAERRKEEAKRNLKNFFNYNPNKIAKISKELAKAPNKSIQLFGTIVSIAFHRDNTNRFGRLEEVNEINPIFPYYGNDSLRYVLSMRCVNYLRENMTNLSHSPDVVCFFPRGVEWQNIESKLIIENYRPYSSTWLQMDLFDEDDTIFESAVYDVPYDFRDEEGTAGRVAAQPYAVYKNLRLKLSKAPLINYIGESSLWCSDNDECVFDYICAKKKLQRSEVAAYFDEMKLDYKNGVSLEDFEKYLSYMKWGYCIIGPDFRIISKMASPQKKEIDIICLVNNSHVYPVENKTLQSLTNMKGVGDLVLEFSKKLIDFKDQNTIILETANLDLKLNELMEKSKKMPLLVGFNGVHCDMIHFDDKIYCCNQNYKLVKENCELFKIDFCNQSLPKLCFEICNKFHKMPPECSFTNDSFERFSVGGLLPIVSYFEEKAEENTTLEQIDISRFYTSILYNNSSTYAMFDKFNDWVQGVPDKIKPGFYRLREAVEMGKGYIKIGSDRLVCHTLLKYLVDMGYTDLNNVYEYVLSGREIDSSFFSEMVEHFYKNYPDSKILKQLFNNFIGYLGIIEKNSSSGFVTSCQDTAQTFARAFNGVVHKNDFTESSLYKVVFKKREPKVRNYRPLWQQVINFSYIQMDKMINALIDDSCKLYAIKTDCLVVSGIQREFTEKPVKANLETIGGFYREKSDSKLYVARANYSDRYYYYLPPRKVETIKENIEEEIKKLISRNCGFQLVGVAGTGKTYIIKNVVLPLLANKKHRILTLTHMAGSNYDSYCVLSSYFAPRAKPPNYDYLIIDEFSMIPSYYMEQLHKLHQQGTKIILVGDTNQCLPIEINAKNYNNSMCINEMTDFYRVELSKIQRYDEKLFLESQNLLNNGVCSLQEAKEITSDYLHLAFTNKKRLEINKLLKKDQKIIPQICLTNSNKMSNGQLVLYDTENKIYLDYNTKQKLEYQPINEEFDLAFCITIHKAQGQTFNRKICLHECGKYDLNLFYTAITRCRRWSDVYYMGSLRNKYLKYEFRHYCRSALSLTTGAIYKLYRSGECIYVGCVEDCVRLGKRILEHKGKNFDRYEYVSVMYYNVNSLYDHETLAIEEELKKGSKLLNCQKIDMVKSMTEKINLIKEALKFVALDKAPVLKGYIVKKKDCYVFRVSLTGNKKKDIKEFAIGKRSEEEALKLCLDFQKRYSEQLI